MKERIAAMKAKQAAEKSKTAAAAENVDGAVKEAPSKKVGLNERIQALRAKKQQVAKSEDNNQGEGDVRTGLIYELKSGYVETKKKDPLKLDFFLIVLNQHFFHSEGFFFTEILGIPSLIQTLKLTQTCPSLEIMTSSTQRKISSETAPSQATLPESVTESSYRMSEGKRSFVYNFKCAIQFCVYGYFG